MEWLQKILSNAVYGEDGKLDVGAILKKVNEELEWWDEIGASFNDNSLDDENRKMYGMKEKQWKYIAKSDNPYINWIVNAPHNAPGAKNRKYFECGEPVLAKAVTYSLDNHCDGYVMGDASDAKLVEYYANNWGADAGGYSESAYPVMWSGKSCIELLRKYGYIQ